MACITIFTILHLINKTVIIIILSVSHLKRKTNRDKTEPYNWSEAQMDCGLRDSGLDIIGEIPWGTHIACLHSQKNEYYDVVIPYIKTGLQKNEKCLWIYGKDTCRDEIRSILSSGNIDADRYIGCGQLMLVSCRQWYCEIDESKIGEKWKIVLSEALDEGYDGLRAVADIGWLPNEGIDVFCSFKTNIGTKFSYVPGIAIFLYNISGRDAYEISKVINSHSYVITRHNGVPRLIKNAALVREKKNIAESRSRYKKLIDILPDAVIIHDEKSIFCNNDAAACITGTKDSHRLKEMSLLDFVAEPDRDGFAEFLKKPFLDESEHYHKCRLKYSDGIIRDVGIITARHSYLGSNSLLSVIRDDMPFMKIYELEMEIRQNEKKLGEALEYDRLKTEFLSNISHEFRTPLNVILSAIQLIKCDKAKDSENIRNCKYFNSIQQNCYRLLRLINNLIDITKIDSNYYESTMQNFDIVKLIKDIVISADQYAENKNLSISFQSNTDRKIMACDPDQIERVILNLLSNAVKFTPNGGAINVSFTDCGDMARISVKDTGPGIPAEMHKKIFERFGQVDKSLKKQNEGSGIGLSIAEALVRRHGGTITVISEPGCGSEFVVDLPCRILSEDESEPNRMYAADERSLTERINIEFSDIYV